jgi:hypothetical protein
MAFEMLATELAENHFRTVRHAVHQYQATNSDQKVPLIALTQFKDTFVRVDTLNCLPWFGHEESIKIKGTGTCGASPLYHFSSKQG